MKLISFLSEKTYGAVFVTWLPIASSFIAKAMPLLQFVSVVVGIVVGVLSIYVKVKSIRKN
jgi:ABC-type multidrug transport system permease subunit